MVNEVLKAAVIGCGRMGAFTSDATRALLPEMWFPLSHANALRQHPGFELVGFADVDLGRAQAAAEQYRLPAGAAHSDYRALIETARPDVVAVATRSAGRDEIIRYAIENGVRGIHTEKPLCNNLAVTEALMIMAERRGTALSYGTIRRYASPYRLAKSMLDDGRIGRLVEIGVCHGADELLLWSHPHSVDLLMYFAGTAPLHVNALCDFGGADTRTDVIDADPRVEFARISFEGDIQGLITRALGVTVVLTGTDGIIRVVSNGERVELHRRALPESRYFNQVEFVPFDARRSPTEAAFDALYETVVNGAPPLITAAEIATNQRLLWSIVHSSLHGGRSVAPGEARTELVITGRVGNLFA